MKKSFILLIAFMLTMCTSPKVIYTDDLCKSVFEHTEDNFIDLLKATEKNYSVVIFTAVFKGEKIILKNNQEILYNDSIKDIGNGFSKAIRVDNRFDVEIKEIEKDYIFTLKREQLKDHKYIYIKKDMFKKKRPYTITYSNTLCGFK